VTLGQNLEGYIAVVKAARWETIVLISEPSQNVFSLETDYPSRSKLKGHAHIICLGKGMRGHR
jgi:hypothetical protein